MHKRIIITLLLIIQYCLAFSQSEKIHVTGSFNVDSVRLGEPIEYRFIVKYPKEWQLLLPDSTYNFAPFEYQKKILFATHTENNVSTDSVLYVLSTFEIDNIQTLALPAYVVQTGDCTVYQSNIDTVFFSHLVKQMPDSLSAEQLPLKINTEYNPVSWLFNYPLFSIVTGALIVIAIILWLVFGKRIKRYFKLKRMNKKHEEFMRDFDNTFEKLKSGFSPEHAERTVVLWKHYMEQLLARPYTKFTTRELNAVEKDEQLIMSLSTIDRSIYGFIPPDTLDSFLTLKEFSQTQYIKKLEEIKHE